MSSFAWMIVLVLLLTALGTLALLLTTLKYYWGERGKPPLTGEARRLQKQEELRKSNTAKKILGKPAAIISGIIEKNLQDKFSE
jgi:hypothetical protein